MQCDYTSLKSPLVLSQVKPPFVFSDREFPLCGPDMYVFFLCYSNLVLIHLVCCTTRFLVNLSLLLSIVSLLHMQIGSLFKALQIHYYLILF